MKLTLNYHSMGIVFLLLLLLPLFSFTQVTVDFSYKDLEKLILSHHPDLRRDEYELEIAQLKQDQSRYARLPRMNFKLGGFPIAPYLYMAKNGGMSADWSQWQPVLQTSFSFDLPIYDFGRTSNLQKAADQNLGISQYNLNITISYLINQIKQLYWGYLTLNSYKKYIFQVTLPEFEKIVNKKEKQFQEGSIKRQELENARLDYLDVKKSYAGITKTKQDLHSQIGLMIGKDPLEELYINFKVKDLYELPVEIENFAYYLSIARTNSPILKKLNNEMLAAEYVYRYRQSTVWPMIGFNFFTSYTLLDFDRQSDYSSDIYPDRGWKIGFGFGLQWSLSAWDHINTYNVNKNQQAKLEEQFKLAHNKLEYDLLNSYNSMVNHYTELKYRKEMLAISQRNFIFTNNAEKTGVTTNNDITNTLKQLLKYLRSYYDQVRTFNLSVANFEKLLGENIIDYEKAEQEQIEQELLLNELEE